MKEEILIKYMKEKKFNKEKYVCWDFVRDIYKDNYKIELPEYPADEIQAEFKKYLTEHNISFEYQYKTKQYPYKCDFYLTKYDLYIEIQGIWTHGQHPFNSNSIEDINKLNEWKLKNTKYYDSAIQTWTVSDVTKRNIAKRNNLNYLEIFSTNLKDIVHEINLFLNNKYL